MHFETPVGLKVPADEECLPCLTRSLVSESASSIPLFWFVGAHGGAGVSTLASVMAPAGEAGQAWPEAEQYPLCVLVARSTIAGMAALDTRLREVAAHKTTCRLLGAVIMADTPHPWPKTVIHRWKSLQPLLDTVGAIGWTLPFIPELRYTELSQLSVWEPGQEVLPPKRFAKAPAITDVPRLDVADLGEEITAEAVNHLKKEKI